MIDEFLKLMRDWIRAEIKYGIQSHVTDSEGYREGAYKEQDDANRIFTEFCDIIMVCLKKEK